MQQFKQQQGIKKYYSQEQVFEKAKQQMIKKGKKIQSQPISHQEIHNLIYQLFTLFQGWTQDRLTAQQLSDIIYPYGQNGKPRILRKYKNKIIRYCRHFIK